MHFSIKNIIDLTHYSNTKTKLDCTSEKTKLFCIFFFIIYFLFKLFDMSKNMTTL